MLVILETQIMKPVLCFICQESKIYIYVELWVLIRVSIQGVKSLWGDCIVFPRLGTGDTERANKPLFMHYLSVSLVPNLGKMTRSPKSDSTPWILTLKGDAMNLTVG